MLTSVGPIYVGKSPVTSKRNDISGNVRNCNRRDIPKYNQRDVSMLVKIEWKLEHGEVKREEKNM